MAERGTEATSSSPADADERRRLLIRGGVASAVIVAMLAGLVLWERNARVVETPAETPRLATPEAIRQQLGQSAPAAETAGAVVEAIQSAPRAAASETIIEETAPLPVLPPSTASAPAAAEELPTPPAHANARAGSRATTEPRATTNEAVPAAAPAQKPEANAKPATAPSNAPAMSPRLVVQAESAPSGNVAPAGKAFAVQVGVFSNAANAEELQHKLAQAGIPAELETRVAVGPFKTRAEAQAAQARLQKLGIGKGQLVTVKR